ncbi:MAG: dienelactone hydrolase family protein [Candidatus Promineifilaceae bacterium]
MALKARMIEYPSNQHKTPAYMVQPDDQATHPAVVVIQEWWGLVPHIKDVTERFAAAGYVALAPDLYHGQAAREPDEARKLSMTLDRDRAATEIVAAAEYLIGLDSVAPKRVGVVGWCMGGGLALAAAAENGPFGAVVAFYGRPLDPADVGRLEVPVLGLYAGEDHGIPVEEVRAFRNALTAHGVEHEVHIYRGAHHAFFNDTRPVYDPEAARDAWRRTLEWFEHYLDA